MVQTVGIYGLFLIRYFSFIPYFLIMANSIVIAKQRVAITIVIYNVVDNYNPYNS